MQHEELLSRCAGQRIDDVDSVVVSQRGGKARALDCAGKRGGDADAHGVLVCFLCGFKLAQKRFRRRLGRFGIFSREETSPELVNGKILCGIGLRAEDDAGLNAVNVVLMKLLAGKVRGGIGDDAHMNPLQTVVK